MFSRVSQKRVIGKLILETYKWTKGAMILK